MQIEYETTIDELVDAHMRALSRSQSAKRARWYATIWTALLTGIILYLYLAFLGAPLIRRFIFAALGVLFATGGYNLTYAQSLRRRIRKHLHDQMPSGLPMRFTVELRDDCIWTKQAGTQISFDWGNVAAVVDTGDAVEVRINGGGLIVARNKGFNSQKERLDFMTIANKHHALAIASKQ